MSCGSKYLLYGTLNQRKGDAATLVEDSGIDKFNDHFSPRSVEFQVMGRRPLPSGEMTQAYSIVLHCMTGWFPQLHIPGAYFAYGL